MAHVSEVYSDGLLEKRGERGQILKPMCKWNENSDMDLKNGSRANELD